MDGEISPDEVSALLDDPGVRIVDVRSKAAYDRGHIPGSDCLPMHELPTATDRVADADRIVTVCPHGKASVRAARLLAASAAVDEETRVESMAGGLSSWEGPLAPEGETEESDAPF